MALDIFKEKGVALDRQVFTWKDLVRRPYSKLAEHLRLVRNWLTAAVMGEARVLDEATAPSIQESQR